MVLDNFVVCVLGSLAVFWALAFMVRLSNQQSTFASFPVMGALGLLIGIAAGFVLPQTEWWPMAQDPVGTGALVEISNVNDYTSQTRQTRRPVIVGILSEEDRRFASDRASLQLLATRVRGDGRIILVTAEQGRAITSQIAVTDFPTYILYNRGREITRIRGAKSADELMNLWRRRL